MEKKRILVGSPVRQKAIVLREFLLGLEEADWTRFDVTYFFVDDNNEQDSSDLLVRFAQKENTIIRKGSELTDLAKYDHYISDEVTHIWDASIIRKVAYFKDTIIEYAIKDKYDYLFLCDSDIVLDRRTIQQLYSRDVDIISNIFWTQWKPNWSLEPQCFWIPALNVQSRTPFSKPISAPEARQIQKDFFTKMRIPGIYKVDGLGACTLIKTEALKKGVRFKEIPNLSVLGEDRHFCIRAGALGIDLYYDTVFPVYHIYREEYLDRVEEFKEDGFKYDMCQTFTTDPQPKKKYGELQRISKKVFSSLNRYIRRTIISRSKKEQKPIFDRKSGNTTIALLLSIRYDELQNLKTVLESAVPCADYFLIYSSGNAEEAEHICDDFLSNKGYAVISEDSAEIDRRQLISPYQVLWKEAKRFDPGWILAVDGSEILNTEESWKLKYLTDDPANDVYRFVSDNGYSPRMLRYQKNYEFHWSESNKLPDEADQLSYANLDIQIIKCR